MKAVCFLMFISLLATSCSSGANKPKKGVNDSIVKDSIIKQTNINQEIKPVYVVKDNFIDIDSIKEYSMVDFSGNLEYLNVFMSIKYNNNYAQLKFENNWVVIGYDTMFMYSEQRIIGFYQTDSSYNKKIHYLIIDDSGDYSEGIDMVSIDSLGKIIDYVGLMGKGGDGGDSYISTISKINNNSYQFVDMECHQNSNDTMEVIEEKSSLLINYNGTFDQKKLSKKMKYYIIGAKAIQAFWEKIDF